MKRFLILLLTLAVFAALGQYAWSSAHRIACLTNCQQAALAAAE